MPLTLCLRDDLYYMILVGNEFFVEHEIRGVQEA